MRLLINFSTLKSGGGQNVAMNFLHGLQGTKVKDVEFYFFVAKGSAVHYFLKKQRVFKYYIVPSNPIQRMLFEIFYSKKILIKKNIDIIYSYFGIGIYTKKIPQISGSADSNLYFPEINFWSHYHGVDRFKKNLIDMYRIWGLKRATAIVFENKALERRSHEIYHLKKTITIKPSINFDFESQEYLLPENIETNTPIGLFLCGWQYNKNIMMIPDILFQLKKANKKFHILLTAPSDNSQLYQEFTNLVYKNNVEDMITVTGQIKKEELSSLYSQVDYVFLLSKLESFSNNIIESWYFNKPLVVADELWSRGICKDAAIYVNRDSASEIANVLIDYIDNPNLLKNILSKRKKVLDEYPSIEERIENEMEFIKNVYKNN